MSQNIIFVNIINIFSILRGKIHIIEMKKCVQSSESVIGHALICNRNGGKCLTLVKSL